MIINLTVPTKLYEHLKYDILDKNFRSTIYRNRGKLSKSDKAAQILFLIIKLQQIVPAGFVRIDRNLFKSILHSIDDISKILNKLESLNLILKYGHGSKCIRTIKRANRKSI